MISDGELAGKVEAAKRGPNYCKLAKIAVQSGSGTNAANQARAQGYSLEEQQDARWIRMYIERRLFNEPDFLREFLDILNLQQETHDGGEKMAPNNEPKNLGYLWKLGDVHLSLGYILFLVSLIVSGILLAATVTEVQVASLSFNGFLGALSFVVFCVIIVPALVWIGTLRNTKGDYSTHLPVDVFRVESAYRKDLDVFAVVSGDKSGPRFVRLAASPKLEIVGFPEKAVGPGEFYLDVQDHKTHTSVAKRGSWHGQSRKWRTCTFIPRSVIPDPVAEPA